MYNSQYEEYYNSLKRRNFSRYQQRKGNSYNNNAFRDSRYKKNNFTKRIIRDLLGTFLLFLVVIGVKAIKTPNTQMVYNYSKKIVNENYNYKPLLEKTKNKNFKSLEKEALDYIEKIKNKITEEKSIDSFIKDEFQIPIEGTVTSCYGYRKDPINGKKKLHNGVDIGVDENTDVIASFNGTVKDCGNDKELGKYILIDHGKGIETKYAHLNNIKVKKQDRVKKGKIIGKSGNTGKSTGPHLHFEIIYMGENKNPQNYFKDFKK